MVDTLRSLTHLERSSSSWHVIASVFREALSPGKQRGCRGARKNMRLAMRTLFTCVFLGVSTPQPARAQETSGIPGAFVDIGVGAGPMGMAGASIVLGRDVYAIVTNPAGLSSVVSPQAAFSMTKQFSLIPYNLVLYGQRVGKFHLGGGFLTAGDDALRENTLYLAGAHGLRRRMTVGVSLKIRQASFGDNSGGAWEFAGGNRQVRGDASGFSLDVGLRGVLSRNAGFGIVLKDALGTISYDAGNEVGSATGGDEDLTPSLMLGFGYVARKSLVVEVNLRKALKNDTHDRFILGLEQSLLSLVVLRAGMSQNIDADETNRHYSLGLGVTQKLLVVRFAADFAYVMNDIDNFFHAGLRVAWEK